MRMVYSIAWFESGDSDGLLGEVPLKDAPESELRRIVGLVNDPEPLIYEYELTWEKVQDVLLG